jgi:hypothetical protein
MICGWAAALLTCAAPALSQTAAAVQPTASISGAILDDTGIPIPGARITLTHENGSPPAEAAAREAGEFSFANIAPGSFSLTVSAPGFAERVVAGIVASGEAVQLPPIRLTLAAGADSVEVTPTTREEIAQRQIEQQEQQRVFGFVPNFYVSYDPDALPLNTRQKFELSWKSHLDPIQFASTAGFAWLQQRRNEFPAFGDGWEGYAKRYAAAFASNTTRSLITQVVMPTVFKQDPRYFYLGTGSTASRFWYAMSRSVIRKGDNGEWQPNYSSILGGLASGAISNFYYPEEDRHGIELMLENTAIGLATSAISRLAQEFLLKKITTHTHPAAVATGK